MLNGLTLGISTIGDLLLKNKISKLSDGTSLDGINLVIPEYQRPYKWTAKNANQLLDDIEESKNANKEVYRVGTLILHHDGYGNYNNQFTIVNDIICYIFNFLLIKQLIYSS